MLQSFLLYGLLKNFVIHLLMTLSMSMTSVFFVHASDSPAADYSILFSFSREYFVVCFYFDL